MNLDTLAEANVNLANKVELLNWATDGSLSIIHYTSWELSSYQDGTLFENNRVRGKTFREVVEKAWAIYMEHEKTEGETDDSSEPF